MIKNMISVLLTSKVLHLIIKSKKGLGTKISRFCYIKDSQIGNFSYVGPKSIIKNCNIGNYCSISSNVTIGLGAHPTNFLSTSPIFYNKKNIFRNNQAVHLNFDDSLKQTIIGNDVWIGANVIILDGVKIGNGAIIATGAVVTKNVLDFEVVGGVPARVIRKRFSDSVIEEISKTNWWNLPLEDAKKKSIEFYERMHNEIK